MRRTVVKPVGHGWESGWGSRRRRLQKTVAAAVGVGGREVVEWPYTVGGGGSPPPPPPGPRPNQSDHCGKKRNLQSRASCWAIFVAQISGSQRPKGTTRGYLPSPPAVYGQSHTSLGRGGGGDGAPQQIMRRLRRTFLVRFLGRRRTTFTKEVVVGGCRWWWCGGGGIFGTQTFGSETPSPPLPPQNNCEL